MIWRHEGRAARGRWQAGFTLIEMIVVLAILSFALVLITGFRPLRSRSLEINTAAADIAAQMRLARSAAIAGNRPVAVEFDLAGHSYHTGNAARRRLSPNFSLELLTILGERRDANIGGIRFNPDGSSTGGRIVISDGSQRLAIGVDWLTGRVGVADAH